MKLKIIACSILSVAAIIMAGWYGFTFFQVSKLQSHQIAYMLVYDDFNAWKGVTPGYKQPLPPFALEWYFFSKSIDQKEIKRVEDQGALMFVFMKCFLPQPEMASRVLDHYISNGFNINALHKGGALLHMAAMTDCEFTAKLFLENGADPTVRTNMPDWTEDHNLTALEIAKKNNQERQLLRKKFPVSFSQMAKYEIISNNGYPNLPPVLKQLEEAEAKRNKEGVGNAGKDS